MEQNFNKGLQKKDGSFEISDSEMPDADQAVEQVKRNWRSQAEKKRRPQKTVVVVQGVTNDIEVKEAEKDIEISDSEVPDVEQAKRNWRTQAEKKRKNNKVVV